MTTPVHVVERTGFYSSEDLRIILKDLIEELPMIEVKINPDVVPAGSDLSIVNAARRSFNTRSTWEDDGVLSWGGTPVLREKDKRLLEFLARGMTAYDFNELAIDALENGEPGGSVEETLWKFRNTPTHDTPFNHTFISFEVKAPIFVRAQLVKHEYLIMSEFSRRYKTDDIEFYKPEVWRKAAENKKQGSSAEGINPDYNPAYVMDSVLHSYHRALDEGVAPEQARMLLPQSTMTEWTWSGTLGAFAKMCRLRLHPEAQHEARIVAEQVYKYLKEYYPVAAPALVEGV